MGITYDFASIPGLIVRILNALPVTLIILFSSLAISLGIGALVAAGSMGQKKGLQGFCRGWIAFMRGVPTLVMIFLLYLGLPQLLDPIGIHMSQWNKLFFIITTLSLTASANMAEMIRTSYLAVDKGQREAALSVGMTNSMAFKRIVFPQAFGIAIPMLGNNMVALFKETSLAFTIGILDILGRARSISSMSYGANKLEVYIASAIIYWIICVLIEQGTKALERSYTKGRKRATA